MDSFNQLLSWIAGNETLLSGIAATIAIVAVVFALSNRAFSGLRSRNGKNIEATDSGKKLAGKKITQEIRFCRAVDGINVAWSSAGQGYPLIRSMGFFSDLEKEWESPAFSQFWQQLASRFQLIRYDGRSTGLSDRNVSELNPDSRLEDLESVIEAAGVEKFALIGMSEGGTTAIRYAAKYPQRVSHLIIWGSFLVSPDAQDVPQIISLMSQAREHWGDETTAFHQMFTALFLPEGNAEQNKLFNQLQMTSASPETASAFFQSINQIDVRDDASRVQIPALVMHRKGDLVIPVKYGQQVAARLPNARMVLLEGSNHWMVTEGEDMKNIVRLIDDFVLNT